MKSPAVADSSPFQLDATNERLLYRTAKGTKPPTVETEDLRRAQLSP
jgi:hypothetical protein